MSTQITSTLAEALRMTAAVSLALLITVIYPGAESNTTAQTVKNKTAPSPAGGQKEGITVHGHWTIEVRNPDGTLATRWEFENDLSGHLFLAKILARQKTPGIWGIGLVGTLNSGGAFFIWEPGPPAAQDSSTTLVLSVPTSGANANALVLEGNGTAFQAGYINRVYTLNRPCNQTITPAACNYDNSGGGNYTIVTGTNLTSSVPVVAGQIIQVTVVISFSSPSAPTTPQ